MPLYRVGFELLASTSLGSAAVTTGAITIPGRDVLLVLVRVLGYSGGGDIASLRFNGDSTTTNYHSRHINISNASTPVLSSTNFTANGHIVLGPVAITVGRMVEVAISNNAANRKICTIREQEEATAQATFSQIQLGYGEWFNTAAQITSIELRTNGGTNTMNAGTGFVVYGRNF